MFPDDLTTEVLSASLRGLKKETWAKRLRFPQADAEWYTVPADDHDFLQCVVALRDSCARRQCGGKRDQQESKRRH